MNIILNLSNIISHQQKIYIDNRDVEKVKPFNYLGRNIHDTNDEWVDLMKKY